MTELLACIVLFLFHSCLAHEITENEIDYINNNRYDNDQQKTKLKHKFVLTLTLLLSSNMVSFGTNMTSMIYIYTEKKWLKYFGTMVDFLKDQPKISISKQQYFSNRKFIFINFHERCRKSTSVPNKCQPFFSVCIEKISGIL